MDSRLQNYKAEVDAELKRILQYWMQYALDEVKGGFIGRIDNDNNRYEDASKGSVLNSRILWSFSAAYQQLKNEEYRSIAHRAFQYLQDFFIDKEYGGVYWSVTADGQPLDAKKQIYALSFAVYGLSEYYKISENKEAKEEAIRLYQAVVQHSYYKEYGGYLEALARDWQPMHDLRLSAKDANEKKSMNTHLHVLEGFANLYKIWPDSGLSQKIKELIQIFLQHIIDKKTHHLVLFFNEAWHPKSTTISYGHDIEAAWLVQEAAEIIGAEDLLEEVKKCSIALAIAAAEGLNKDGGLWYEKEPEVNHLVKEKHSWPQAESMVGFFNAWQLTGDETFLNYSMQSWRFIQQYILDKKWGEWYWGVQEDYAIMHKEDKVGIWKCPYHNSRACMEISKRITQLQ